MSTFWMRHFELHIVDKQGNGISLSDFNVVFSITWADTKWPRVANIKIYNLSTNTNNLLLGKEFSRVRIIAGYDGLTLTNHENDAATRQTTEQHEEQNYGLIFEGDIRYSRTGQDESGVDRWIQLQVIDGWHALLHADMNNTLASGWTTRSLFNAAMAKFNAYGITEGIVCEMPTTEFPRGTTQFHSVSDAMDEVARNCNATWQIVEGKVNVIAYNEYLHDAITLNCESGLLGSPEQTLNGGIRVRSLINPNIRLNGLLNIDQRVISRAALSDSQAAQLTQRAVEQESIGENDQTVSNLTLDSSSDLNPGDIASGNHRVGAADGVYIVKSIDYKGDTRGQDWEMVMMCMALGARKKATAKTSVSAT